MGRQACPLFGRVPENVLTVGIESQVEETNTLHEALGLVQLTLTAKQSLDELNTGVLAELRVTLFAGSLEHGRLARLQQLAELVCEALARFNKVIDQFPVLLAADAINRLLGTLDLAGQLD